jgi:hypothetical protein
VSYICLKINYVHNCSKYKTGVLKMEQLFADDT